MNNQFKQLHNAEQKLTHYLSALIQLHLHTPISDKQAVLKLTIKSQLHLFHIHIELISRSNTAHTLATSVSLQHYHFHHLFSVLPPANYVLI